MGLLCGFDLELLGWFWVVTLRFDLDVWCLCFDGVIMFGCVKILDWYFELVGVWF